jgi:hypothetical protein
VHTPGVRAARLHAREPAAPLPFHVVLPVAEFLATDQGTDEALAAALAPADVAAYAHRSGVTWVPTRSPARLPRLQEVRRKAQRQLEMLHGTHRIIVYEGPWATCRTIANGASRTGRASETIRLCVCMCLCVQVCTLTPLHMSLRVYVCMLMTLLWERQCIVSSWPRGLQTRYPPRCAPSSLPCR